MWYLRWERDHVTGIHCYIFSEIFLLTTFFTRTHQDKTIGLQQGKSLVLTQNKDSNLKTEWASERNSETRPKFQRMNRTVSLPSCCQPQAYPASLPTEETIPSLISRRITRSLLFLHKRYLFLSFSVSIGETANTWLLSVESNCNQPQILFPHGDLGKTFEIRCWQTGTEQDSKSFNQTSISRDSPIYFYCWVPSQAGFGVGYLFLHDW